MSCKLNLQQAVVQNLTTILLTLCLVNFISLWIGLKTMPIALTIAQACNAYATAYLILDKIEPGSIFTEEKKIEKSLELKYQEL